MRKQTILLHKDELDNSGIEVSPFSGLTREVQVAHRDDHFMFIVQKEGRSVWELDFNETVLKGASLCYIAPGQVHRHVSRHHTKGWLVFIAPEFIINTYLEIFDAGLNSVQSVTLKKENGIFKTILLLTETLNNESLPFRERLSRSLVDTLAGMVASKMAEAQSAASLIGGQKYHTVIHFKKLVKANCINIKQVQHYAAQLHITPLYLNEIVKEITGFPASYWIHSEILLEAKRMLRYTTLDVKQIAFDLGYDDHAYFSRFFKKHTGITATDFREQNH